MEPSLEYPTEAFRPKRPRCPARSGISDIVGDVKEAMDSDDAGRKPVILILVVVSRVN